MTILLLAGSGEAKQIATGLAALNLPAIASLAGATRAPKQLDIPMRIGGFGGADGFRRYLAKTGIRAVIDATHPYATQITNRTAAICAEIDLPYLHVLRAPWVARVGDNWTEITCEEDAAALIPKGSTVFLGTGRQTLDRFSGLLGCRVICRQIDPPTAPFPFEGGEFLIGRPPFPVAREKSIFAQLGIEWIVVKNAGGDASATKLTAARQLGIPVLMIARPVSPKAMRVDNAADALSWAQSL
ncbi:MAG: precorrin-6A/cobalt-precorrin-6A reductase [Gammaproteobacteria bacterium]|jgi:precorrin-6A/cobalt-precorrin-6A reductase